MTEPHAENDAPYCPDCLHLWDAHFDNRGQWIDCDDDRPKGHVCGADCLDLDSTRLPWRDRLSLAWIDLRRRFRRCPECERRGYGNTGPGPGRTYRWVDDPVVIACGFQTAPHRCNTCGQESERPGDDCDCKVICSMGPTCPGAILAGLNGAGCHRVTSSGEGASS